jgi:hypothetical protein
MIQQGYNQEILEIETWLKGYEIEKNDPVRQCLAREIALIHCLDKEQTFNFSSVVGDDAARESLKAHILNQLIHEPLLRDDEQIGFGIGGCKPRYRDKAERQAIIIMS